MPVLTGFASTPLPGPAPLPVLGHLPRVMQFLFDPIEHLTRLSAQGDVVAVCRDNPALVCVFGAERNREVLTNLEVFRNDEGMFPGPKESSFGLMNEMITGINGEAHARHRRLMAPAFSKAKLEGYAEQVVDIAERMVASWPRDKDFDLDEGLRDLSLRVAGRTLFGAEALDAGGLGELTGRYARAVTNPMVMLLPRDLPGTPYRRASRLGDALFGQLEKMVRKRRAHPSGDHDALSLLLSAAEAGDNFSDRELLAELVALFFAGYETTARTLSWTMFLLDRHPEVLSGVLQEIDEVLAGRSPSPGDFPRMPRVERAIKESMRLLPPMPMLFFRVLSREARLGDVTLPPRSNVLVSPYITQRDPKVFSEPKRFRPERWETIDPSPFEYLPFGGGPRVCIGAAFARQTLRLVLPTLLQRARFSLVPGARIERHVQAIALTSKHGMPMRLLAPHRRPHVPAPIRGDLHELVDLPTRS